MSEFEMVNPRLNPDYDRLLQSVGDTLNKGRSAAAAAVNTAMVSRRISTASAKQELRKLLSSDELDKPVRELSGGMRRRVCIVRACIIPSDIIILDEPFAGLDRVNRQKAIQYIKDAKGTTPLVITDHSAEGLDFCRKVTFGGSDAL